MKQTITRKGSFDAGHRVMYERVKCFNIHGHLYQYELTFEYDSMKSIGYAIDFKEIKRIACEFIDEKFDHGFICNPQDTTMLEACNQLNSKVWTMSLDLSNFCNPTAENIAKELFLCVYILMANFKDLTLTNIRLYETPNCFVDCTADSIPVEECNNFFHMRRQMIERWRDSKGIVEYDSREINEKRA